MNISRRTANKFLALIPFAPFKSLSGPREQIFDLKRAIDHNVMVFDSGAKPGEFTLRLAAMMKIVYRRNCGFTDERFEHTPDRTKYRLHTVLVPRAICNKSIQPALGYTQIIPYDHDYTAEFLKQGASLRDGDRHLIIGVYDWDKGLGILGSC
jgi:hypothetical protein